MTVGPGGPTQSWRRSLLCAGASVVGSAQAGAPWIVVVVAVGEALGDPLTPVLKALRVRPAGPPGEESAAHSGVVFGSDFVSERWSLYMGMVIACLTVIVRVDVVALGVAPGYPRSSGCWWGGGGATWIAALPF